MKRLRVPAVIAVSLLAGASCTKGTGPELDAATRGSADAGSGTPHDAGTDGRGSGATDAAPSDAMPDTPLG